LMQLFQILILNDICHASKNIEACQILHHHILALELDMDVFKEVLEPYIEVPIPKAKRPTMPLDCLDSKVLQEELGLWVIFSSYFLVDVCLHLAQEFVFLHKRGIST
jgi:hypothetical protein